MQAVLNERKIANYCAFFILLFLASLQLTSKLFSWNPIFFVFPFAVCLNLLCMRSLQIPANCLGAIGILNFEYTRIFAGLYLVLQGKDFAQFCRLYSSALIFFGFDLAFQWLLGSKKLDTYLLEFYYYFVLLHLVPKARFDNVGSLPKLIAWTAVIGLLLSDPFFSGRLTLAFNPNVDAALVAVVALSLSSPLSAALCTVVLFRSRSVLLAVATALVPFTPRKIHFFQALLGPFFLQLILGVFFDSTKAPDAGFQRLIPIVDQSAQHHSRSIAEGLYAIVTSPYLLLGNGESVNITYLQDYATFPHNAFLYSVLSNGLLYSLATLFLLFRLYSSSSPASGKLILSWLVFCGFSDIGLDFFFVAGVCAAAALINFGWVQK